MFFVWLEEEGRYLTRDEAGIEDDDERVGSDPPAHFSDADDADQAGQESGLAYEVVEYESFYVTHGPDYTDIEGCHTCKEAEWVAAESFSSGRKAVIRNRDGSKIANYGGYLTRDHADTVKEFWSVLGNQRRKRGRFMFALPHYIEASLIHMGALFIANPDDPTKRWRALLFSGGDVYLDGDLGAFENDLVALRLSEWRVAEA